MLLIIPTARVVSTLQILMLLLLRMSSQSSWSCPGYCNLTAPLSLFLTASIHWRNGSNHSRWRCRCISLLACRGFVQPGVCGGEAVEGPQVRLTWTSMPSLIWSLTRQFHTRVESSMSNSAALLMPPSVSVQLARRRLEGGGPPPCSSQGLSRTALPRIKLTSSSSRMAWLWR